MNQSRYSKHLIDKDQAIAAMNDGFAVVCGEKHRAFLTDLSEQMVSLGMANGRRWANDLVIKADRISTQFEMAAKGIVDQQTIDAMVKDLLVFFSDEEIEQMKVSDRRDPHPQHYMQGLGEFERLITDRIKAEDMTAKQAKAFDYFKAFPVHRGVKSPDCSLYGEAGLGLDAYRPADIRYGRFEGELCYPIENICRKYHYLGQLLARQAVLLEWVEKIKSLLRLETDYFVGGFMAAVIYRLAFDSYADEVILDLQDVIGRHEAFLTHRQVSQRISRWSKTKEGQKALDDLADSFDKK
jgi:hypothetical protein